MTAQPHPVDAQVGQALSRERKAAGWSQQRLADALSVSFQQLQKYERGSNRLSASKLFEACQALGLRPSALFGGDEKVDGSEVAQADRLLATSIQGLAPAHRRVVMAVVDAFKSAEQTAS